MLPFVGEVSGGDDAQVHTSTLDPMLTNVQFAKVASSPGFSHDM